MSILVLLKTAGDSSTALSDLTIKKDSVLGISSLVAEQVPDFVRVDHPRMVTFMEAYYEWMEQKNETLHSTFVLRDFADVDDTISNFIKHFKTQYLDRFPQSLAYDQNTNSAVDEKRLIKRIKEFYRAKGTEKSYKLLFKILQDATITDFYYPKTDIVKSSNGKWIENKSIKVSLTNKDEIWNAKNTTIVQKSEAGEVFATGTVRGVRRYETQSSTVAELVIDEINGKFRVNKNVHFDVGGNTAEFTESTYSVIENIKTYNDKGDNPVRGSGYKIGEKVTLSNATGGTDAFGLISEIDGKGGIISVEIINSGISYKDTDPITFNVASLGGTGAGLTASIGAMTSYSGYYFNTQGQPSSNKRMFDNYFYQDFSYEIKTNIALKSYKDTILDLVHPSGTKLFNMMLMKNTHPVSTKYKTTAKPFEISILGHYTPYTWNTAENLRHNSQSVDLYPVGYNPTIGTVNESGATAHSGTTASGRSGSYWGLVYNDYAGRTSQNDSNTGGNTFAYDLGVGGTWDAGTTGPLWYLSQGIFFTAGTGGASASYEFLGTADAGDFDNNGSYWVIYPHPNIRGIDNIPSGCSFSAVKMNPFFYIDRGETGGIETEFSTNTPT